MPKPIIGHMVHYVISEYDAGFIQADRIARGMSTTDGNAVTSGDTYPATVVRVWGDQPGSAVNLQVFLDGADSFWATSRTEGDGAGHWHWPAIER